MCFCMNKLIFISSDNHKGTRLRLLEVPISMTFMYNGGSAGSSLFIYTKL